MLSFEKVVANFIQIYLSSFPFIDFDFRESYKSPNILSNFFKCQNLLFNETIFISKQPKNNSKLSITLTKLCFHSLILNHHMI